MQTVLWNFAVSALCFRWFRHFVIFDDLFSQWGMQQGNYNKIILGRLGRVASRVSRWPLPLFVDSLPYSHPCTFTRSLITTSWHLTLAQCKWGWLAPGAHLQTPRRPLRTARCWSRYGAFNEWMEPLWRSPGFPAFWENGIYARFCLRVCIKSNLPSAWLLQLPLIPLCVHIFPVVLVRAVLVTPEQCDRLKVKCEFL